MHPQLRVVILAFASAISATAGAQKPAGSPAAPASAKHDTLPPLTWALGRDDAEAGKPFDAWLAVRAPSVAPRHSSVTLTAAAGVEVWFRKENETCEAARTAAVTVVAAPIVRDTLLYACAVSDHDGATRLAAIHRAVFASDTAQAIAVSDAIHVASRFAPGPGLLALWTALIGLLGGVTTYWIQRGMDARSARLKNVVEMQNRLSAGLVGEMRANRDALVAFTTGASAAVPDLAVSQYLALLGDDGLLAYLGAEERRRYFGGIQELYSAVNDFDDLKNATKPDGTPKHDAAGLKPAAQRLLDRLSNHLTTVQP